ncbi:N-acetylmuramoyl-L-alanine amidase [Bacteroidia bacterium]|nr:N-acetylmuramoyl-L-alanine amidase [Bacteroidia bacterium]
MKRAIFLIVVSTLLVRAEAFAQLADNPFVVVIDPGHGGHDSGAVGRRTKSGRGGKEKDITLAVTLKVGNYIKERHPDVKVVYTRDTDVFVELDERANIANRNKADLFISIHTNSAKAPAARGSEVFSFGVARTAESLEVTKRENAVIQLEDNYKERYDGFDPNSAESYIIFEFMQNKFVEQSIHFATQIQDKLKSCVPWRERGVKQAQFLVLRKSAMPRVLIELDFISNPEAEKILMSEAGRQNYAKAIGEAFTQYKVEYDRKNNKKSRIITPVEKPEKAQSPIDTSTRQRPETENVRTYKVQIFTSDKELPPNAPQFKGHKVDFYLETGIYKYTCGESTDMNEIAKISQSIKKDFNGAFIVTFENGKRVINK